MAMKDYTFIRPGVAVSISAATLVAALVIGALLIRSLSQAATTVRRGGQAAQTLHSYNAALEVWRQMAASTDPAFQRPEARQLRDSIRTSLTDKFVALQKAVATADDSALIRTVLEGLASSDVGITTEGRQAMIVLLAHQDAALFEAAEASQRAVLYSAILLGLSVLAAGLLVIPMAFLYIRYKRGATIEVRV